MGHKSFIAEQLDRLSIAGHNEFAKKLLELAGRAEPQGLARVKRGVDAIVAGQFQRPSAPSDLPDDGPTFAEFARRWTSGELRRDHRDHVAEKRSVAEDVYRFEAHIYPLVGDVPLRQFKLEHAEAVMRALPEERSPATRRHVAQLMSRVLKLAVYPGRILEQSPIPRGFLPKPGSAKALAWLYPREELALLANGAVPLLHRLFYGFLAREGLRSGEAGSLTWSDVDLETGTLTLDANKTDDPRAWAMGKDVAAALSAWKALSGTVAPDAPVFARNGKLLDVEHLAVTFRGHLSSTEGVRPLLFEKDRNRRPIRIHDLRATFVTLALAAGRTETWVADRTGHKSSTMINGYRRAARTAAELGLGWLEPLDQAIPELRSNVRESSAPGAKGAPGSRGPSPNARPGHGSRRVASDPAPLGSSAARRAGSTPVSRTGLELLG